MSAWIFTAAHPVAIQTLGSGPADLSLPSIEPALPTRVKNVPAFCLIDMKDGHYGSAEHLDLQLLPRTRRFVAGCLYYGYEGMWLTLRVSGDPVG